MALQKAIEDPNTGATAHYWRVVGVAIDAGTGNASVTLGGYVSPSIRARPGGQFIAQRHLPISGAAFAQLAGSPAVAVSEEDRAEIELHLLTAPPAVAAYLSRALSMTVYAAYADPAYKWARAHRRECVIDPDTGEGLIGAERWPADHVVKLGDIPTVPSEFADAMDV